MTNGQFLLNATKSLTVVTILTSIVSTFSAHANCTATALPNRFQIDEKALSTQQIFLVNSPAGRIGEVQKTKSNNSDVYVFENEQAEVIATGTAKSMSWGTILEIRDCDDQKIGEVRERISGDGEDRKSIYTFADAEGKVQAVSKKISWLDGGFNIKDSSKNRVANFNRSMINLVKNKWEVDIDLAQVVDFRSLVIFTAFKTQIDEQRRKEHEDIQAAHRRAKREQKEAERKREEAQKHRQEEARERKKEQQQRNEVQRIEESTRESLEQTEGPQS